MRDRRLRRLESAFSGFNIAEYGVWVSVLVYAYKHGGVNSTAAVAVAQLVPAGLLAPVLARSVDLWGAAAALRRSYAIQSLTLGLTAVLLFASADPLAVYGAAVLGACAVTMTRPAQTALVPALVSGSEDLTAVNVVSGWVEGLSILAGPALAGVLIGVDGPPAAISAFAVGTAVSALLVRGVGEPTHRSVRTAPAADWANGAFVAARRNGSFTELVALLGAQYLVIGMLDVLLVVFAISVLGLGAPGAGYLNAAFGAGGVMGSVAAVSLVGKRRLVRPFVGAAAAWSLLLIALGAWPTVLGAFLLLGAAGVTRTVLDVSGRTILQAGVPADLRGRAFGVVEGVAMLALALGSLLVPVLVGLGGARTAVIVSGLLLSTIAATVGLHLYREGAIGALTGPPQGTEVGV